MPSGAKLTVAMQNAEVLVVSSTMLIVTHSGSTCMGLPPIDFDAYEDEQGAGLQDLSPRSVARLRAEKIEEQHAAEQAHEDDYGHSTAHLDRMLDPDSTIAATSKKAKSPSALPPRIMYGIILHDAGLLKLDALADILRTKCNCIVMEPRYENTAELVGYWARTGAMGLSTVIRGGAKVIASGIKLGSGVAIQREWIPRYQTETGEVQKLAVSSPVRNSVKYTKEASGWLSDSTKQTIQNAVKGVREKLADEKGTWKEWLSSATADIAGHRYGDEVHSVAKDSVEIAQNLLEVKESLSGKAVATQELWCCSSRSPTMGKNRDVDKRNAGEQPGDWANGRQTKRVYNTQMHQRHRPDTIATVEVASASVPATMHYRNTTPQHVWS
eukprot:g2041.t1